MAVFYNVLLVASQAAFYKQHSSVLWITIASDDSHGSVFGSTSYWLFSRQHFYQRLPSLIFHIPLPPSTTGLPRIMNLGLDERHGLGTQAVNGAMSALSRKDMVSLLKALIAILESKTDMDLVPGYVPSNPTWTYPVLSCHVLPCPVLSGPVMACPFLPCLRVRAWLA